MAGVFLAAVFLAGVSLTVVSSGGRALIVSCLGARCHRLACRPCPHAARVREPLSPWPFAGMIGLACVAFLIAATPVVVRAPWWSVVVLARGVAGLARARDRLVHARPRTVALLPIAVVLVWLATVVGGATYLGWGLAATQGDG